MKTRIEKKYLESVGFSDPIQKLNLEIPNLKCFGIK
jgi:hypothetical protein